MPIIKICDPFQACANYNRTLPKNNNSLWYVALDMPAKIVMKMVALSYICLFLSHLELQELTGWIVYVRSQSCGLI